MTQQAFEKLLSDALDESGSSDAARAVDEAVAADPALARVRDEWRRVHAALGGYSVPASRVNWALLRTRIVASVNAGAGGRSSTPWPADPIDEPLRAATASPALVDWPRLQERISRRVRRTGRRRRRPAWTRLAAYALATAATIALLSLMSPLRLANFVEWPDSTRATAARQGARGSDRSLPVAVDGNGPSDALSGQVVAAIVSPHASGGAATVTASVTYLETPEPQQRRGAGARAVFALIDVDDESPLDPLGG